MANSLFDAFAGHHFDPVFVLTAATSNARDAVLFDVPGLHPAASRAIEDVVNAACLPGADTTLRTLLIEAPAGYGKTHRLTTTLLRCARDGRACPAVLQLSARVEPNRLSRWMLHKITDELAAGHFRDDDGLTPLQKLASVYWSWAPAERRERFLEALDADDVDATIERVREAVPAIRRASPELRRSDDRMLCVLLLKAEDASPDIDSWLRGGALTPGLSALGLAAIDDENAAQDVILAIARLALIADLPLVIGIDQIEAIARITDDTLLTAVVTTALQLVENCPGGIGLIIAALLDTYRTQLRDRIDASFRQRVEMGRVPVRLDYVDVSTMREIVNRRVEVLLERAGVDADPIEAGSRLVPGWLLEYAESNNLREILQVIREYRQASVEAGHLLDEDAFVTGASGGAPGRASVMATPVAAEQAPATQVDFDKLWADCCDAALDAEDDRWVSQHDREQLLTWLFHQVAAELPDVEDVVVESRVLDDAAATPVLDVTFRQAGHQPVERWCVGFADAPNRLERFADQVGAVIASATNAYPAVIRTGRILGITDDGAPDRPLGHLLRLQAGPVLADLLACQGRVRAVTNRDWLRLELVRRFYEERREAVGFVDWCRQRCFLASHCGLDALVALATPGADGLESAGSLWMPELVAVSAVGQSRNPDQVPGQDTARHPVSIIRGGTPARALRVGVGTTSANAESDASSSQDSAASSVRDVGAGSAARSERPMAEVVDVDAAPDNHADHPAADVDEPEPRRWTFREVFGLGRARKKS